jgi:two-component system copper resistance phosphate regulon response regulator CusR
LSHPVAKTIRAVTTSARTFTCRETEEIHSFLKIVLVEDDLKVGTFLQEGLRGEAFLVDRAYDGDAALEMAGAGDYDLILLDYMLPKKSGVQVAASIRGRGQQTPILMLTARDSDEDVRRGRAAGVNQYLSKPFKFDDLLNRIHALVGGKQRGGDEGRRHP